MNENIRMNDVQSTRRMIGIGFSYVLAFAFGMVATAALLYGFGMTKSAQLAEESTAAPAVIAQPAPQTTALPIVKVEDTLAGMRENMRLGSANAPVQIVVFADPQCPYCKQSALETEQQIIKQYVNVGEASLVYRHFTFLGAESQRIALAMECAAEQGVERFWAFHQQVFEKQFPENSGQANDATLASWANAAGVEINAFKACIANPATQARVDADVVTGRKLGVLGTPTLFINGRPMPGAVPFAFLKETIDSLLAIATKK